MIAQIGKSVTGIRLTFIYNYLVSNLEGLNDNFKTGPCNKDRVIYSGVHIIKYFNLNKDFSGIPINSSVQPGAVL